MRTLFALLVFLVVPSILAQDKPKKPSRPVPADIVKQIKDKKSEEIAALLRDLNDKPLPVDDVDKLADFKRKKATALIGMADALLNTEPSDDLAEEANKIKLNGLGLLLQLKPDDVSRINAFKRELEKDGKFKKVIAECDAYLYIVKIRKVLLSKRVTEKDFNRIGNELIPLVKENPDSPYVAASGLLLSAVEAFEGDKNLDGFADKFREEFIKTFRETGNEKLQEIAAKIEIDNQQELVPGKRMKIAGMTIDGKPFDIKMLRGKVVLIDFWATWCGPCRGEIPNMKEMYMKYHGKGFEIVGISIDKDVPALKEFVLKEQTPWIAVSDTMTVAAGMPSLAATYGVRGIPAMYLLDKEGRVVSTSARGGELKRLLETAFK